jgi:PAS domain S-box-containing protein
MLIALMVSLVFFSAGTIVLSGGIFTLQGNPKVAANKLFFVLTIALAIWSFGMAGATVAADAATSEAFRRIASIGWGTFYAFLLHFILDITGKPALLKKWWFYLCLYLPALFTVFLFAVPNGINPHPYNLRQTKFGWFNVPHHNIWDWFFYAYYACFVIIGLLRLYQWGKKSSDAKTIKKSRAMLLSILSAVVLGTITDIILNTLHSELPQLAPVIMLIPTLSTYHILQKDNFRISKSIDKKATYINLFLSVLAYIILASLQVFSSNYSASIGPVVFNESVIRGSISQMQMFLLIYLVLKENRPGYISAIILNLISFFSAAIYLIRYESLASLPGIIFHAGMLVVITLIKVYKEKNDIYAEKISTHAVREEFYTNIIRQSPIGIAIVSDTEYAKNEEFDDVSINPSYERILGRTRDELKNIEWTQITHPDDLETDLEYFEQFKKGKMDYYYREKRYIKPDGSVVWVDMLIFRIVGKDRKPGDHVCIITDITERKKIEATLKYNSEHVLLTGLYNRSVLEQVLESDASQLSSNKRALVCI